MKILLTTHHLKNYSGSKRWTYTMAKELSKEHDVTVATPIWGCMGDKMKEICKTVMLDEIDDDYDIGIINQVQTASAISKCKKTIYVVHGGGGADAPLKTCDKIFVISQELQERYGYDILENPVDTNEYNCPQNVLYVGNDGKLAPMIARVCLELEYPFKHLTKKWEVAENIKWADVVISVGRGMLEAMSCGKRVIIADYRKYNGAALMDNSYESGKSNNWSGRADRIIITEDILKDKLLGNRKIILNNHKVENICQKLLQSVE